MALFETHLAGIFNYQYAQIQSYLNYKLSSGVILSKDEYNKALSSLYRSTDTEVRPIPVPPGFYPNAFFSKYSISNWALKVKMNLDGLMAFFNQTQTILDSLGDGYESVTNQALDNYEKLTDVLDLMSHLSASVDVSQIPYSKQVRNGDSAVLKTMDGGLFPLQISDLFDSPARNYSDGFTVSIIQTDPRYVIEIKHNKTQCLESFIYLLDLKKEQDSLYYRISADNDSYSNWYFIQHIRQFQPLYNIYGEYIGMDFRIIPATDILAIDLDWFTMIKTHTISVRLSKDYGMVRKVVFQLKTPEVVDVISLFNYSNEPFLVDNIEGSLDNSAFMAMKEGPFVVDVSKRIYFDKRFPVKYLRLTLKQETYHEVFESPINVDSIINNMLTSYTAKSIEQKLFSNRLLVAYNVLQSMGIRNEIRSLLNYQNIDDHELIRKYRYTIAIDDIKINEADLIESVLEY